MVKGHGSARGCSLHLHPWCPRWTLAALLFWLPSFGLVIRVCTSVSWAPLGAPSGLDRGRLLSEFAGPGWGLCPGSGLVNVHCARGCRTLASRTGFLPGLCGPVIWMLQLVWEINCFPYTIQGVEGWCSHLPDSQYRWGARVFTDSWALPWFTESKFIGNGPERLIFKQTSSDNSNGQEIGERGNLECYLVTWESSFLLSSQAPHLYIRILLRLSWRLSERVCRKCLAEYLAYTLYIIYQYRLYIFKMHSMKWLTDTVYVPHIFIVGKYLIFMRFVTNYHIGSSSL